MYNKHLEVFSFLRAATCVKLKRPVLFITNLIFIYLLKSHLIYD